MIQLLYYVIFAEMAVILTLLFKTPLRKVVIMALDRVKRGRGPIVVKSIAATFFIVLYSSVYSMVKIQKRTIEAGVPNPTDQVLMSRHLLEASLMGFLLFLSLMIDRLHHYIRELRLLRKTMEASKRQNRNHVDVKTNSSEEAKAMEAEIKTLKATIEQLESAHEARAKQAKDSTGEADALRRQSEGLLNEYDRLLADNQNLRNQLETTERTSIQPDTDGKKNI